MKNLFWCYICKNSKPADKFYKDKSRANGLCSKCKECSYRTKEKQVPAYITDEDAIQKYNEIQEARRIKILGKIAVKRKDPLFKSKEKKYQNEYWKSNLQKSLWIGARKRSKEFNLPFNIEIADVVIPEICPLLNVPMEYGTVYAPSLDKIIPSLGYIKGNVMVISRKANTMKNDASIEQLKIFAKSILSIYT